MAIQYINPETMHQSPVFTQGIVIPAGSRMLMIGGQNGVDETGTVVSKTMSQSSPSVRSKIC